MIDITLIGNYHEIGMEHGRAFASDIRPRVDQFWKKSINNKVLKALAKTVPFLEKRFPDIVQEIRGISEGADCSFESVFLYNNRGIVDATTFEQCSQVGICESDSIVVGMNKDIILPVTDRYFVKKILPQKGLSYIGYGHVGRVWGHGMNESGLCTAGTAAYPLNNYPPVLSVGMYLLPPLILSRCRTVAEAIDLIMEIESINDSGNLLLADATGQIRVVEITPHDKVIRTPDKGAIFTTNYFVSGKIEHRNDVEYLRDARERYRVIEEFCESERKPSIEYVQRILSAHRDKGSICRHQDQVYQTALSWVADIVQRKFMLCDGYPCCRSYQSFDFKGTACAGNDLPQSHPHTVKQ
ncbi:MAG: C45 family peptidase [Phycisphaerae bacterium]